jgi:hypothetical protein
VDNCEIRIYDADFNWVGAAHTMESVQFERNLYGAGMFEIHIHPDKSGADQLIRRGNIIIINGDPEKSGVVRNFRLSEDKGKSEFIIYGETGNGFLRQRIIVPPTNVQVPGAGGGDKIDGNTESILKHYVERNVINPFDTNRKFQNFAIAPNLNRGGVFNWQARYSGLLEELEIIGNQYGMGFQVYADLPRKQWVFDVIEGRNRGKNQSELSPVSFNMAYQNVSGFEYSEDYSQFRNTGYIGGKGENESREFYIAGAENTGRDRHEVFVNCSNAANSAELQLSGQQKMSEYAPSKTIEASALPNVFLYGRDYFLGDAVNLFIARLNLDITAKVTASKEIWERQTGYKTEIRFGEKVPNLFNMLLKRKDVVV